MDAPTATLKALLLKKDSDFKPTADYFFDHFLENVNFLKESKTIKDASEAYYQLLQPIFKNRAVFLDKRNLVLNKIQNYPLIQGLAWLVGGEALLFYFFEDIQVGIGVISSVKTSANYFFQLNPSMPPSVLINPAICSDHHAIH